MIHCLYIHIYIHKKGIFWVVLKPSRGENTEPALLICDLHHQQNVPSCSSLGNSLWSKTPRALPAGHSPYNPTVLVQVPTPENSIRLPLPLMVLPWQHVPLHHTVNPINNINNKQIIIYILSAKRL